MTLLEAARALLEVQLEPGRGGPGSSEYDALRAAVEKAERGRCGTDAGPDGMCVVCGRSCLCAFCGQDRPSPVAEVGEVTADEIAGIVVRTGVLIWRLSDDYAQDIGNEIVRQCGGRRLAR